MAEERKYTPEEAYQVALVQIEAARKARSEELDLSRLGLDALPPEIGQLASLEFLDLHSNQLVSLPPEIGKLTNLRSLDLEYNPLAGLPVDVGQLARLKSLWLNRNQLTSLPPQIGLLASLEIFNLESNQLVSLPTEIGLLTNLQRLDLGDNQLTSLPLEIGKLISLRRLTLDRNQLSNLPPEIDQLTSLEHLWLNGNQLTSLPPQIGQLGKLKTLLLTVNQLTSLPPQMGQLANLKDLSLEGNPLASPPQELAERGTKEVIEFLKSVQSSGQARFETKLLLVGEGKIGKSSLLRALRGEDFIENLDPTHAIDVSTFQLPHPAIPNQSVTFHTWDFGGQQIYHNTHQFFLTPRSIYLVVWSTRQGIQQSNVTYWLDTIKTHAPTAPVFLVATHVDLFEEDINFPQLKEQYPQLVDHLGVSNHTGEGIEELKTKLVEIAEAMPHMGLPWPADWLAAEKQLEAAAKQHHHINFDQYLRYTRKAKVEEEIAGGTFGGLLHDLGRILYYRDDPLLNDLIVLQPNWVTKAIGLVLTEERVKNNDAILPHEWLPEIWAQDEEGQAYERSLYPIFLRLMERFDISYQLPAEGPATRSLVPLQLRHQPPKDIPDWPAPPRKDENTTLLEMHFNLPFVPPGIASRFIVRTHHYTTGQHWRNGVILEKGQHMARFEFNEGLGRFRLVAWGQQPHAFFTKLKDTLLDIFDDFDGLEKQLKVPCICHWQPDVDKFCNHYYDYNDLVRLYAGNEENQTCPQTLKKVSIKTLLFGIHPSTDPDVMDVILENNELLISLKAQSATRADIDNVLIRMDQQSELIAQNFARLWNTKKSETDAECPNTFYIVSKDRSVFHPKDWVSQPYHLTLLCQHPPGPHPVGEAYPLRQSDEWWQEVAPWLNRLVKFLRFAIPKGEVIGEMVDEAWMDEISESIDLFESVLQQVPTLKTELGLRRLGDAEKYPDLTQGTGGALRALCTFLTEADKNQYWADLRKTYIPDGNVLWLCAEHREPYEAKPLQLPES